ncbi:GNAT family N-acetyltransferase [Phyllobacterium ifriqiyense]|uniref:GNAT family N-acetyltransferase n=1 Tax=Phyllobacterium ifriqiyense TaxID=314238 RepID=UPI003396EB4A
MIETSRLLLRPQRIEDFELYKAIWINDPNLSEGVQVLPGLTDEQSWDRLLRWIGHWNVFGYGPLLVIDRQTGELVGETGVARFHRANGPAFDGVPEALWRIKYTRHGQGLASEAAYAALQWYDARKISERTVCMIDHWNDTSLKLAGKLGFKEFSRAIYKDSDVVLLDRIVKT